MQYNKQEVSKFLEFTLLSQTFDGICLSAKSKMIFMHKVSSHPCTQLMFSSFLAAVWNWKDLIIISHIVNLAFSNVFG